MKKLLTLISIIALALTLTLLLSGCSGRTDELEGKNIVTFMVNGGVLNYGTSSTKTSVNFAYYPGTYILDPSADIPNYSISRSGYDFTGWYTDEAGILTRLVLLPLSGILTQSLICLPSLFMQAGKNQ